MELDFTRTRDREMYENYDGNSERKTEELKGLSMSERENEKDSNKDENGR